MLHLVTHCLVYHSLPWTVPRPRMHHSVYTYLIGLQTFVPILSSEVSSVPGPRSPSFLQRQTTISIQLSSLNCLFKPCSHLPFVPHDLDSYLSINTWISTYLLFPAQFMTEDRTHTNTYMDPRSPSPNDILEELVNTLRLSLMSTANPQSASASPMAMPAAYAGDSAECGGFLLQVALSQEMQPQKFLESAL